MKKIIVKKGDKYNYLTVLKEVNPKKRGRRFLCECICGKKIEVDLSHLRGGQKSCGCIREGSLLKLSTSKFGRIFYGIKTRCNNKNSKAYKNYGGRGIKCLWNNLEEFYNDMYDSYLDAIQRYGNNVSIERLDVNGHYCKENCIWIKKTDQYKNKRNNVYFYKGELLTDYCKKYGININLVKNRINNLGRTIERAVQAPPKKPKKYFGKTLGERSKILGVPRQTLYSRIVILGHNPEKVLLFNNI